MGLLALGTPLVWSEAKKHADYVREHGIEQFLNIWERLKDRTGDRLLWGDEVSSLSCRPGAGVPGLAGMHSRWSTVYHGQASGCLCHRATALGYRRAVGEMSPARRSSVPRALCAEGKQKGVLTLPKRIRQIEYLVISYDDAHRNACLSLRQTEILQDLQADAEARRERGKQAVNGNGGAAPGAGKECA